MRFFARIKNYVVQKRRRGFTLIEVLMAMMLTASLSGLIIGSVVNSMNMRQKALSLNRAITLARLGRTAEAKAALQPFANGGYGSYRKESARQLIEGLEGH